MSISQNEFDQRREDFQRAFRVAYPKKIVPPAIEFDEFMRQTLAEVAAKKPKTEQEMRDHYFATIIAPRLKDFGFDERFRRLDPLAGEDQRCKQQRRILAQVRAKCQNTGSIMALIGPRGTGKTTIASALAAERIWQDWEATRAIERKPVANRITSYRKAADLIARFKAYYGDFGTIQMDQLQASLDHICSVDVLVIDELHEVPEDSRHKDRLITDILDKRYAARRDTLLISNQTHDEFWSTLPDSVKSRINEHGGILRCEWRSFREEAATTRRAGGNDL